MVELQKEGLKFNPNLMLIQDAISRRFGITASKGLVRIGWQAAKPFANSVQW